MTNRGKQHDKRVSQDETWKPEMMVHKVYGFGLSKNLTCRVNREPPQMSYCFRHNGLVKHLWVKSNEVLYRLEL